MGFGVVVLAATRPFEGALACVPVAAVIGWWLLADRTQRVPAKIKCWVLPFFAVLFAGAFSLAKYNHAVTGEWTTFPYAVNLRQYFHQGVFIFSKLRPPERQTNARLARFAEHYRSPPFQGLRAARRVLGNFERGLPRVFLGALGDLSGRSTCSMLWISAVLIVTLKSRWIWFCLLTIAFVFFGESLIWWWWPHYSAPIVPLAITVFASALRRIDLALHSNQKLGSLTPIIVVGLASAYGLTILGDAAISSSLRTHNTNTKDIASEVDPIRSR